MLPRGSLEPPCLAGGIRPFGSCAGMLLCEFRLAFRRLGFCSLCRDEFFAVGDRFVPVHGRFNRRNGLAAGTVILLKDHVLTRFGIRLDERNQRLG